MPNTGGYRRIISKVHGIWSLKYSLGGNYFSRFSLLHTRTVVSSMQSTHAMWIYTVLSAILRLGWCIVSESKVVVSEKCHPLRLYFFNYRHVFMICISGYNDHYYLL